MANKIPKTRNELIQSGLKMYRQLPQFADWSEDDLWVKAAQWADKQIELREQRAAGQRVTREAAADDDLEWRANRENSYREQYEWNDANDEASLDALLSLEMQMRVITRELEDPHTEDKFLAELRRDLANLTKEHRTLQKDLGIDRNTRQKERSQKNVVDDWDRIKQDARDKLEALIDEFGEQAAKVETEADLRDRMKYHFAIPFRAVDDVLSHHRRVLGLDPTVQKS